MEPLLTEKEFKRMYKLERFADKAISSLDLNFPIYPNVNIAKIVSYLTFDGHLRKDLRVFLFTAGNKKLLADPIKLAKKEFNLEGKFRKIIHKDVGESYEYSIHNGPISRLLNRIGTPAGNKMFIEFRVPTWIKNNKELSRAYLQTAFDCEGSIWKEKYQVRIRFKLHKSKKLAKSCIDFLSDLRNMLHQFGVETTNIWITDGNIRKDGKITKGFNFQIKAKDLNKFKEKIGFNNKDKDMKSRMYLGL